MATGTASAPFALARGRTAAGAALLVREAPLVVLFGLYVVFVMISLPQMLVQDSWMTLASGREIAQHGLPGRDALTAWSHGARWTDQQWLAQVAFYGLDRIGGIKLVLLSHALLLSTAFAAGLAAARARGASHRSVVTVAVACTFLAPWGMQMRAQSFAPLLFVALLWLLLSDSRAPSRRVLLVLPILVLWANIHGTVALGALLVLLRGLTRLSERRERPALAARPRTLESLVLLAAPALVLASPYGTALVAYYREMLGSPVFRDYVEEWQVSAPSARTALFYVAAFAATALVARRARDVNRFEFIALLVVTVSAVMAIRSIVWFALACAVMLPALLDREPFVRRLHVPTPRSLAAIGVAMVVASVGFVATRPATWFESTWPTAGLAAVVRETAPANARVLADDAHSDWLLWKLPQLRGRVAYDVRFELLSQRQLDRIVAYRERSGRDWRAAARGYGVIVLDAHATPRRLVPLYGKPVYADRDLIVLRTTAT